METSLNFLDLFSTLGMGQGGGVKFSSRGFGKNNKYPSCIKGQNPSFFVLGNVAHPLRGINVVSFKPIKCNNAYRFLIKIDNKQCHSHTVHKLPEKPWREKQYKVFSDLSNLSFEGQTPRPPLELGKSILQRI